MNDETEESVVLKSQQFDAAMYKKLEKYGPFATGRYDENFISLQQNEPNLWDPRIDVTGHT